MKTKPTATAKVQPYAAKIAREILDLETLDSLYGSWKRDVREFRRMAINTTDEAFYS